MEAKPVQTAGPVKLPFWTKLGYGLGSMELGPYNLFYIFFTMFLTDVAGVPPAAVSIIMLLAILFDGITDPIIGNIQDNTRSKHGRRRPYMLAVVVPFMVVVYMTWTVPGISAAAKVVFYTVMACLYWLVNTVWHMAFFSLGAEMSHDYDERTSINSFRTIISAAVGSASGFLPMMMIGWFTKAGTTVATAWTYTAAIFGVLTSIGFFIAWLATRGREPAVVTKAEKVTAASTAGRWVDAFKIKSFTVLVIAWVLILTGNSMSGGAVVYYLIYHMGFQGNMISLFILFATMGWAWVPVIKWVTDKVGKKAALFIFLIGGCMLNNILLMFIGPTTPIWFVLIVPALYAAGNSAFWMNIWSMAADVVEIDEFQTGQRREGLFMGIISFIAKVGTAIAMAAIGSILAAFGYVPNAAAQTPTAILGIKTLCAIIPFACFLLSTLALSQYNLTKERHRALLDAIQLKKEGKPYSTEAFKMLLSKDHQ